jgi:glycerophosphoryl diester phosphodiesterase
MYAFKQAVAVGADMLELDVQLTGDGVLIVQHDADTAKTTPVDLVVADTDLATLQELDNAYWFSPQCWPCHDLADDAYTFRGVRTGEVAPPPGFTPDDFRIITLAELAAAFPAMPLDIEIKGEGDVGLAVAEALAAELMALDRVESTVVAAFDSTVIQHFHSLAPDVAVSPGVNEMAAWLLGGGELADHYRIIQVPPFYETGDDVIEVLSDATLATATAAGVAVWVWPNDAATQENEAYYRELVAMGVHGIIAGRPAAAAAAVTPG